MDGNYHQNDEREKGYYPTYLEPIGLILELDDMFASCNSDSAKKVVRSEQFLFFTVDINMPTRVERIS